MNQVLGVDSTYIKGDDNICADGISHLKKDDLTALTALFQKFSNLATYRHYYLTPELISTLCNTLINRLQEVPILISLRRYFEATRITT